MNDFAELESELKKLRPIAPSAEFGPRIARALESEGRPTAAILPRQPNESWTWRAFFCAALALASVVVLAFVALDKSASPSQPQTAASGLHAEGLTQVVYAGRDEGLIYSPNDPSGPRRRVRLQARQTLRWSNAQTGASLRVSYPVEQVLLQPVSFE